MDEYDPSAEFAQIAYMSGRANALLEAQQARETAADAAGDRIVAAAQSREIRRLWGDDAGWSESGAVACTVIRGARTPWRAIYLTGYPTPILVTGDQVLTDGLLAWRLGAPYAHWRFAIAAPPWPRIQAAVGRVLDGLFFEDA